MAVALLKLKPVKKAGAPIGGKIKGGAAGNAAHNSGTRVTHGAAGKAAYLAGERIVGENGLTTDYRNKFGVEYSEVVLPGGGTMDREHLWNAVDAHKTQRETANVAYSFIVAYPSEFSADERKKVARDLALWIANRYQIAVDYGMHLPEVHKGSDERNFHGHYLISERRVSPAGELGNVQRDLNNQVCRRVDLTRGRIERRPTAVAEIRSAWERIANEALELGGHSARIDMRATERTPEREPARSTHRQSVEQTSIRARAAKAELEDLARSLRDRIARANERIDGIQRERRVRVSAAVHDRIGDMDQWVDDPMKQFMRAWASADRASALRRQLREIDRRMILRAASKEEDRALRMAGRERQNCANLMKQVIAAKAAVAAVRPDAVLEVAERRTSRRVRAIAAEAMKFTKAKEHDFER